MNHTQNTHTHTHTHTHTYTCRYTYPPSGAYFKSSADAGDSGSAGNYNTEWAALRCPPLSSGLGNDFYQATWDYVQDTRSGMAKWGDIIRWDTSAVLTMNVALSDHRNEQGGYVQYPSAVDGNPKASVFTTDSLPWNTAKVTNMVGFLYGAEAFNADVSAFDTSSVTNMRVGFQEAHSFNGTSI